MSILNLWLDEHQTTLSVIQMIIEQTGRAAYGEKYWRQEKTTVIRKVIKIKNFTTRKKMKQLIEEDNEYWYWRYVKKNKKNANQKKKIVIEIHWKINWNI